MLQRTPGTYYVSTNHRGPAPLNTTLGCSALIDALPTEQQRRLLNEVVSLALVEIRHLCGLGLSHQAGHLADVMHNIPREMYGWGDWSWQLTVQLAAEYNLRWLDSESPPWLNYEARLNAIRAAS